MKSCEFKIVIDNLSPSLLNKISGLLVAPPNLQQFGKQFVNYCNILQGFGSQTFDKDDFYEGLIHGSQFSNPFDNN